MYDIGQAHRQGLSETADTAAIKKSVEAVSKLRWAEVDGVERTMGIGTPQKLTEKSSEIDREFFDYYRTPRGQHPRSSTAFWRTGGAQMMLFWSFANLDWIFAAAGVVHHRRSRAFAHLQRARPSRKRQSQRNSISFPTPAMWISTIG
jgi:hypothetical protein